MKTKLNNEVIMLDDMPIEWFELCYKCVDTASALQERRSLTVGEFIKNLMILKNTTEELEKILKKKIGDKK